MQRVLLARGIDTPEAVRQFVAPSLKLMPDPLVMADADKAVARLADAVQQRERLVVWGDYDVDGAAATAIMVRYLQTFGMTPDFYIPDRVGEGYGPNCAGVSALADQGHRLMISVDAGIVAHEPLALAAERGMQVIVIDHHAQEDTLPTALAIVNPNRRDCPGGRGHGLGKLCAAAVAWCILVGVNRELRRRGEADAPKEVMHDLLSIAALATVCDVMPLRGLNRSIVFHGLRRASKAPLQGFVALAGVGGIKPDTEGGYTFTSHHCGWVFGPRINAAGRIADCSLGANLLITNNADEASRLAAELNGLNEARQEMCARAEEEAAAELEARFADGRGCMGRPVVLASPDWHEGIVGILAGRIRTQARAPAFALSINAEKGIAKGSGRSIDGFNLGAAVQKAIAAGVLAGGGGHPAAAGISLPIENISAFADFLDAEYGVGVREVQNVDTVASPEEITVPVLREMLDSLEPTGNGNREPAIVLRDVHVVGTRVMRSGKTGQDAHIKVELASRPGARRGLPVVFFNAVGTPAGEMLAAAAAGGCLTVVGEPRVNEWQDRFGELRISAEMIGRAVLVGPSPEAAVSAIGEPPEPECGL